MSPQLGDLTLLESLQVQVDTDGEAFMLPTVRVPFSSVMQVALIREQRTGSVGANKRDPAGTAWREIVVEVKLVTDDRMADPTLLGLGVRSYATDGSAPALDDAPLLQRARAVAEAAGRICGKKVVDKR